MKIQNQSSHLKITHGSFLSLEVEEVAKTNNHKKWKLYVKT
jgi:hypothetical protein